MSASRRHSKSVRPSVPRPQRHVQKMTYDEQAIMDVLQNTPACSRERDMALIELTDAQLAIYLELKYGNAGDVDVYRQSLINTWRNVDANPHIYNRDGTTHWGIEERKH